MGAFMNSKFDYCPLVNIFHSRTLNNQINEIHERALRTVYKDDCAALEQHPNIINSGYAKERTT